MNLTKLAAGNGRFSIRVTALFASLLWLACTTIQLAQQAIAATAAVPTVLAARVGGDEMETRFVIDLSAPAAFAIDLQREQKRIVVDLLDAQFDLPAGAGKKVRGLVKEFTYGTAKTGKSQIVIDTATAVDVTQSFAIKASGHQPARIVIDFAQKSAANPPIAATEAASGITAAGQRRTIVIDPGHGGVDPGAVSSRHVKEKDVVLAFAKALKLAIVGRGNYDVRLTREDDTFIKLADRRKFARAAKADLFLAIHADTVRGQSARGMTLYTLSDKASDAEAEALARQENQSDIIAGFDLMEENHEVADILIDLAQRESRNLAVVFSQAAVDGLGKVVLMAGKPIRSAGFVVLKSPDVPSVLIELGYLSSREDEKLMTSSVWQDKTAQALAMAVDTYFSTAATALTAAATP